MFARVVLNVLHRFVYFSVCYPFRLFWFGCQYLPQKLESLLSKPVERETRLSPLHKDQVEECVMSVL